MTIQRMLKRRAKLLWTLPAVGVLLMAADPAWKNKTVQGWTAEDADQVLTNSPWSKLVVAAINRKQSEDERRAGGNMGDAKGVGYDGIQQTKAQLPTNLPDLLTGRGGSPSKSAKSVATRRWGACVVQNCLS